MSLQYIRDTYRVPAKRGGRVEFQGRPGTITSTDGARLRVRLDGDRRNVILHPTWEVTYADAASPDTPGARAVETAARLPHAADPVPSHP